LSIKKPAKFAGCIRQSLQVSLKTLKIEVKSILTSVVFSKRLPPGWDFSGFIFFRNPVCKNEKHKLAERNENRYGCQLNEEMAFCILNVNYGILKLAVGTGIGISFYFEKLSGCFERWALLSRYPGRYTGRGLKSGLNRAF
jgi:hypothetical protein